MKKLLTVLMAALMLLTAFAVPTTAAEEAPLINYYNSIEVDVVTDAPYSFSPSDFNWLDCTDVYVYKMEKTAAGYNYTLVLKLAQGNKDGAIFSFMFNHGSDLDMNNARENSYIPRESVLVLDTDKMELAVGESRDIKIVRQDLADYGSSSFVGVAFALDPQVVDESKLVADSFKDYGITSFVPLSAEDDYVGTEDALTGTVSPIHTYLGTIDTGDTTGKTRYDSICKKAQAIYKAITKISTMSGITKAHGVWVNAPGGMPYSEWYHVEDKNVATVNDKGEVVALSPGTTVVHYYCGMFGYHGEAAVTVTVTEPQKAYVSGDVNGDAKVNSLDAALILKVEAGLAKLSDQAATAADIDGDGKATSLDAAKILKKDAGIGY